jgi:hypothetical protein
MTGGRRGILSDLLTVTHINKGARVDGGRPTDSVAAKLREWEKEDDKYILSIRKYMLALTL